eukprot:TRINITY_DN984_c0_g2_i1.p1 TRINITY_DN984_c0_g2~~TRINITY_DN984_c0_g2_i1.p1  ORF type:complete len:232 (+),score=78.85 TRINITY_DN984_c0_g2_i1:551-1246(+)
MLTPPKIIYKYKDKQSHKYYQTKEEEEKLLSQSTTIYVGNLSFYTTEEQIYELFSTCGELKHIIMGLDRVKKTPCGFCFVEYYSREDASDCIRWINGTKLDDRIIRTDWDTGFKEGRQYGRGKSGGQVRDEYRQEYDPGRGGYGKILQPIQKLANIVSSSPSSSTLQKRNRNEFETKNGSSQSSSEPPAKKPKLENNDDINSNSNMNSNSEINVGASDSLQEEEMDMNNQG